MFGYTVRAGTPRAQTQHRDSPRATRQPWAFASGRNKATLGFGCGEQPEHVLLPGAWIMPSAVIGAAAWLICLKLFI